MDNSRRNLTIYCTLLLLAIPILFFQHRHVDLPRRRLLVAMDPRTVQLKRPTGERKTTEVTMDFQLPASASDWCAPTPLPPLDYHECKNKEPVNSLPILGGLTNSLKIILLGAILSYEEDRCFTVDEQYSALPLRRDPANKFETTFMDRYFEPMGLAKDDPLVVMAKNNGQLLERNWLESWDWKHNRRVKSQVDTIESLGLGNIHGHDMKRIVMKRMWRPLPHVRETGCKRLEEHVGPEEFITFSVRRGDKHELEHFQYATTDQYIESAEKAIEKHFDGKPPIIFVASDDCTIMQEFRDKRPDWRFVSECDAEVEKDDGFRLTDMADWTHEQTDEHFRKFFVELYAMAASKYFIGVIYTNVTWWALFMRSQDPDTTFEILETPGTEGREGLDLWR